MNNISVSFLVLDFRKYIETNNCLASIRKHALFPHKIIYLDNGGYDTDYPNELYRSGLCDVLIRKKIGNGGGYGQTDLIRFCDTEYFFFVQNDQELILDITDHTIQYFMDGLHLGYDCIDLNGDQSRQGIWTDRAHFMMTDVFNKLGPFPNGGPGLDYIKWNEKHLQEKFKEKNLKIFHCPYIFFKDCGKWSVREAGGGIFRHRCDTKVLFVDKIPSEKTEVYPPLTEIEWNLVLKGLWPKDGMIPSKWKEHSFICWKD